MPDTQMDDEKARETLGIKSGDWIVAVSDEELVVLKAALRTHTEMAKLLAEKIERI